MLKGDIMGNVKSSLVNCYRGMTGGQNETELEEINNQIQQNEGTIETLERQIRFKQIQIKKVDDETMVYIRRQEEHNAKMKIAEAEDLDYDIQEFRSQISDRRNDNLNLSQALGTNSYVQSKEQTTRLLNQTTSRVGGVERVEKIVADNEEAAREQRDIYNAVRRQRRPKRGKINRRLNTPSVNEKYKMRLASANLEVESKLGDISVSTGGFGPPKDPHVLGMDEEEQNKNTIQSEISEIIDVATKDL